MAEASYTDAIYADSVPVFCQLYTGLIIPALYTYKGLF